MEELDCRSVCRKTGVSPEAEMDVVTGVELECSYGAGDGRTRSGVASMPKERSGGPRLDWSCDWEKYGYDRKSANGDIETTETALTASSSKCTKKRKAIEKEREKRACHICGRDNHLMKDCFFKGKPKCTNCGRFNHETSECRSTEKGKGKSTTTINSVTTQNGKHRKVERIQQARCHAPNRFGTVKMEDNVNIK